MRTEKNIFQIWYDIGEKVPFAVRRIGWSNRYYTVVERIEIKKWPYGDAYGYPVDNGQYSNHYEYDKRWRMKKIIPLAGCYQWKLVEDVKFLIIEDTPCLKLPRNTQENGLKQTVQGEKSKTYSQDKIRIEFPSAYLRWSPDDDENLKNLYLSGKPVNELACIFQRKESAIESRLIKLGLKS